MTRYTFETPYEFEDQTYEYIEYDLNKVKGYDISAVKKQFNLDGNMSFLPTMEPDFCAMLLARVTKQPLEFFMGLPAKDYCKLTQQVGNFLTV